MKSIPLTKGKFALVDDEDFEYLNQFKWQYNNGYASRSIHVGYENGKRIIKKISMHRFIMNTPEEMQTDHINHNGTDNQRSNLRVCTNSQNQANSGKQRTYKGKPVQSQYIGVRKSELISNIKKPWRAQIMINYKISSLGYFKTEQEAAAAYNQEKIKHFKSFAMLN